MSDTTTLCACMVMCVCLRAVKSDNINPGKCRRGFTLYCVWVMRDAVHGAGNAGKGRRNIFFTTACVCVCVCIYVFLMETMMTLLFFSLSVSMSRPVCCAALLH